jgi:plasmid stability protein
MPRTITVRGVPEETYDGLKEIAASHGRSMEAEARRILEETTRRRLLWARGAVLADLSGPDMLGDVATPYVRSPDLPREVPSQ